MKMKSLTHAEKKEVFEEFFKFNDLNDIIEKILLKMLD